MELNKNKKILIDKINDYRKILNEEVLKSVYKNESLKISQELDALIVSYYQSAT